VWTSLVARTTSSRYSSSCHPLRSMSTWTVMIASVICVFRLPIHDYIMKSASWSVRCSISSAKGWRFIISPRFNCCTRWILYTLNHNLLRSTLCTVARESRNSREARRVDFVGLSVSDSWSRSTTAPLTLGQPLLGRSRTLPVSKNLRCQSMFVLSLEGGYWSVCGNFVVPESLNCLRKTSLHSAHVPEQSPFYSQLKKIVKMHTNAICWSNDKLWDFDYKPQ
jgi:hypothetical protein